MLPLSSTTPLEYLFLHFFPVFNGNFPFWVCAELVRNQIWFFLSGTVVRRSCSSSQRISKAAEGMGCDSSSSPLCSSEIRDGSWFWEMGAGSEKWSWFWEMGAGSGQLPKCPWQEMTPGTQLGQRKILKTHQDLKAERSWMGRTDKGWRDRTGEVQRGREEV